MKEIRIKRTSWSVCFLLALALYVLGSNFEDTMFGQMIWPQRINDIYKMLAIIILVASAFLHIKDYQPMQWICFGSFGIIAVICCLTFRSAAPVLLLLFWINMSDVELKDILYIYFGIGLFVFLCAVLSCAIGLVPNILVHDICYCVGYSYSNAFGTSWMCLVITYLALRKKQIRIIEMVICIIGTLVMYLYSKCDSAAVVCILALCISLLLSKVTYKSISSIVYVLGIVAYPLMVCITHTSVMLYEPSINIWYKLNQMLNGRLTLGQNGMNTFGAKWFGQTIEWIADDWGYNIVDSSYLYVLIQYGAVLFTILITLYVIFGIHSKKKELAEWSVLLILIAIHSFVEGTLITINTNPVLIGIGVIAFQNNKTDEARIEVGDLVQYIKKRKFIVASAVVATVLFVTLIGSKDYLYCSNANYPVGDYEHCKVVVLMLSGMVFGMVISIVGLCLINLMSKRNES